jgi:hypothetical protein
MADESAPTVGPDEFVHLHHCAPKRLAVTDTYFIELLGLLGLVSWAQ